MSGYDEVRAAELLTVLRPAPAAWVRAAQELPALRRGLDDLVVRASQDAAFRRRLVADLERALLEEGVDPTPPVVRALRRRLGPV